MELPNLQSIVAQHRAYYVLKRHKKGFSCVETDCFEFGNGRACSYLSYKTKMR